MAESKEFYTANVAFTTPSGRMHIGHGLGATVTDVALRYSAIQRGKKTFMGFGIHSTGRDLPKIIQTLENEGSDKAVLDRYNLSLEKRDQILSAGDINAQVSALVEEYRDQYQTVLKQMGIAINYDTFFSTHQKANEKFTQWTLRKLDEKGLITETESDRPYCTKCEEVKHIAKDQSEVSAVGKVDWEEYRIGEGVIHGGEFECRAHPGTRIELKKTKELAIDYGDLQTQDRTIALTNQMAVFPVKHKKDLEEIIWTRTSKPFERRVEGMVGAASPFNPNKKVEALADSNIYMEFYALSEFINNGKISPDNINDSLLDFVYLGKGDLKVVSEISGLEESVIQKIQKRINEVYPVDVSVLGFEHKDVHLPFSLFTRTAILPDKYFFPEVIITSHVTKNGEKMSKSKGNVVYLDDLVALSKKECSIGLPVGDCSGDAIRFFLSYYQTLDKDFDWNDDNFRSVGIKGVERYVSRLKNAVTSLNEEAPNEMNDYDKWLSTLDQTTIRTITEKMDSRDTREALIDLVDIRGKALGQYLDKNKNPNHRVLSGFIRNQIDMGYPVMPRIAKGLKEEIFHEGVTTWPSQDSSQVFPEEYQAVEHEIQGSRYEKELAGEVNAKLGKGMGKKEFTLGETVLVKVPTHHQRNVLEKQKIPMGKNFNIEFVVNSGIKVLEVCKK